MQAWVIQENDFKGDVKQTSKARCNFYRYSLWRLRTGEHLFDGAAGDLTEAIDTVHAHIRYLSARRGTAAGK